MVTVWLPTFFKISCFVFNRRKKLTVLEQLEGASDDKMFILG